MRPASKLFYFSLLFSLLSFLLIRPDLADSESPLKDFKSSGTIIDDFLVNDDAGTTDQGDPNIASDSSGNFVITWTDWRNQFFIRYIQYNSDIYAQRYNGLGIPLGSNFKVNVDDGSTWQSDPAIAMNRLGNYVITWIYYRVGYPSLAPGYPDVFAQRYDNLGNILGSNFKVNDDTGTAAQYAPAIALDDSGNFVITFHDYRDGPWGVPNIYAQKYNPSGTPLGTNFMVNNYISSSEQYWPAIAMDGLGNFVIVWQSERTAYDASNIYAQRYNSTCTPLGTTFRVNDTDLVVAWPGGFPAIAMNDSGNFVIAWQDYRCGGLIPDIYAQRYEQSGVSLGSNFKVNDDTGVANQLRPAIAMDGSGKFVITWQDARNGNWDVYAQRYDTFENRLGSNYVVANPQYASFFQISPTVAANDSKIYFTWEDNRRGKGWDIYAKVVDWSWGTSHMVLNPGILNFIAMQNGTLPPAQSFTVSNDNGGTFSWTLSHKATWLDVIPDSGSGYSTIVTVNVNRTDSLPFASYDTIVVSNPDADNSPQMIPVNYYLSPPPSGPDPGYPDTVSVERMANVPPNTHLPPVHVYLTNDEPLAAYWIPLAFPDSIYNYDIICDSVSFAGTRTDARALDVYPVVDNNRNLLFIPAIWFAGQLDPGNGPIAKIYFSTGPNWKTEYSVPINATIWPGGPEVPPGIGLQCVDYSGQFAWTPVFRAGALDVKEHEPAPVPSHFELCQNYPNPFNPFTTIPFQVGGSQFIVHSPIHSTLKIYNILGQLVRTLVDEETAPGKYEAIWDGKDDSGKKVSSGIYFYQLKTPDYTATKKMVLLR